MNLISVTSWSARKRHLADPTLRQDTTWGSWLPTLCNQQAKEPGGRWSKPIPITQARIDELEPCEHCAKRAAKLGE